MAGWKELDDVDKSVYVAQHEVRGQGVCAGSLEDLGRAGRMLEPALAAFLALLGDG